MATSMGSKHTPLSSRTAPAKKGSKGGFTKWLSRDQATRVEEAYDSDSQGSDREGSRWWRLRTKNANRAVPVKVEDLSKDDVIIAVMGPTGSGKSSFINTATGHQDGVGYSLQSCTTDIVIIRFQWPERSDPDVVFVDTPSFDTTDRTDVEVLNMISEWLKTTYQRRIMLTGILYFHRISDNRMAGTPLKNLRMFKELCGKDALQNIILTTTMWDEVDEETGSRREKELKDDYWNAMLDQGSQTFRHYNTQDSAWKILDHFLRSRIQRRPLLLQREMVDMGRKLGETSAGQASLDAINLLHRRLQEVHRRIQAETARHGDGELLSALKDEREKLRKELETATNMQNVALGKQLVS